MTLKCGRMGRLTATRCPLRSPLEQRIPLNREGGTKLKTWSLELRKSDPIRYSREEKICYPFQILSYYTRGGSCPDKFSSLTCFLSLSRESGRP